MYKIRNPKNNKICYKLEEIQQAFETYYKELYTQPDKADDSIINEVLKFLDLPSIGECQNNVLTAELGSAVSRLKTDKAPGSDRFVSECYKTFKPELTPLLLRFLTTPLRKARRPNHGARQ